MTRYYVLDDAGEPVQVPDLMSWGRLVGSNRNRHVGDDMIGEVRVSTVFLAIDHSFMGGEPILWETMTFGPEPWDERQWRYHTRAAALAGHAAVVEAVRSGAEPPEVTP